METGYRNRKEYMTMTDQETTPKASRWPLRVLFLFIIMATFVALELQLSLSWTGGVVLGALIGFLLRNVQ